MYSAFGANDVGIDGRVFVGVSSTGIYCRPICRARRPKVENCTFYKTAAEAEAAGFRPCLLCRPEIAPAADAEDFSNITAYRAAQFLQEHASSANCLNGVYRRVASEAELNPIFEGEFNVTLSQYLETCRLQLAKSLLTDNQLSISQTAEMAGFTDSQLFLQTFKTKYRLDPKKLHRKKADPTASTNTITVSLGYRPPYLWQAVLDFFTMRTIPGVELVEDGKYYRTVRIAVPTGETVSGWVRVEHHAKNNTLCAIISRGLWPAVSTVLARVRHLFDLDAAPDKIQEQLETLKEFHPRLPMIGMRVPGCFDVFEMAVRAVLGQQITVKAAHTLAGRFAEALGIPLEEAGGHAELTHLFPTAETIVRLSGPIADHLGPLGVTSMRSRTILELARVITENTVDFSYWTEPEAEIKRLLKLPGIGPWTAHYLAMRVMAWPDAFPHADYGIKKALAPRTPKDILALAEAWRPWRAYAAMNLWNSLSNG
ncbi:MAG: DNA-3-methyladenine glycosylase 2 family protein [Firmicutes bacterium]|nr:DNA-3-methyladenine glycosylase 2 family protein [Bacillota bacterium]